jgi:hypothetical protein
MHTILTLVASVWASELEESEVLLEVLEALLESSSELEPLWLP